MNKLTNPAFILRFAIAVGYIILGGILVLLPISIALLNATTKPLFALLLIAYGIFRLYRAIQLLKEEE